MSTYQRERREGAWENVAVELDEGIAWVTLNRPHKRNAMSPALNDDMVDVLDHLEGEEAVKVIVITGAGEAFTAGMDLKEFFRATDSLPPIPQLRARRSMALWQGQMLMQYAKPTIAMVNGCCFGGGFMPVVACDLAIAAEDAKFGLSEINWGIVPAGNVTRAVVATMPFCEAMLYVMTGRTFDGRKAAQMNLVNEAVPASELRAHTRRLAMELIGKNPTALRACKTAVRNVQAMPWDVSNDYLSAKAAQARLLDDEGGRTKAMKQFLDDKSFKPGQGHYDRRADDGADSAGRQEKAHGE
jgi:trans-feruloyl-CoA hydratase/vanillin synthase